MNDRLLTPEDVADKLVVAARTVREWLRSGEMVGVKIGKIWRVREEDYKAFVDSRVCKGK